MKNNQLPISNYIGNVFSLVMLEAATVMQYRTQLDRKIESLIHPRNAINRPVILDALIGLKLSRFLESLALLLILLVVREIFKLTILRFYLIVYDFQLEAIIFNELKVYF